jgi:hypothetical protein
MLGKGIGVYGSSELMTQWQTIIKENGYLLNVNPSVSDIKRNIVDPYGWRGGDIKIRDKSFLISFYPSLPTHSENNPIRGKPGIYIQYGGFFKRNKLINKSLAEEIINIFEKKGAIRFEGNDLG